MERIRIYELSWQLAIAIVISYVFIIAILPVGALFTNAFNNGWQGFVKDISEPAARNALVLTVKVALAGAAINGLLGLLTAYVLVRFEFPGKALLNALVDLPFAIPTNVSGLMLLAVYGSGSPIGKLLESGGINISYALPGVILAVTLVTFPFTIRAVQPVLEEFDLEMEEAAYCLGASRLKTFWQVTLPSIWSGLLSGVVLTFARGLAEFGAVVVVAGNIPMKTQLAAVYIYGEMESYDPRGATSVSVVLVLAAIVLLVALNVFSRSYRPEFPEILRPRHFIQARRVKKHAESITSTQTG
ncbi:MAG TPA: sulfate ABC transporter permease subunit CysT [Desulfobacteria bacterium]|nr:sulfate ABC transporter permease subunit CysT [Desulfobacteria bacterium]